MGGAEYLSLRPDPLQPMPELFRARFRARSSTIELAVHDVSPGGCMVDCRGWNVEDGLRVLVQIPGLSWIGGTIVWVWADRAGVQFEQPLAQPVLDHVLAGRTG